MTASSSVSQGFSTGLYSSFLHCRLFQDSFQDSAWLEWREACLAKDRGSISRLRVSPNVQPIVILLTLWQRVFFIKIGTRGKGTFYEVRRNRATNGPNGPSNPT